MKVSLKNIFFREIGCHSLWELILPRETCFLMLVLDATPGHLHWFFFFIHGGEKKACCQSSKWVRLCCPNLPDRCFISSDGCFLAVTTVHVLSSEKKTVWFSAPSPFKVTFCLSSLLSARFFILFKVSLCLRDLPRVSDESAGKYYPRRDKGVSSGHVPNLHYNYPLSLRLHRLTIIAYIITTTWSASQRHNVNRLLFTF